MSNEKSLAKKKQKSNQELPPLDSLQSILSERYKNKDAIIDRLCEINVDISTYRFLGEIFFQFLKQDYENGSMPKDELDKFLMIRFEILEMYELALAAKTIRY